MSTRTIITLLLWPLAAALQQQARAQGECNNWVAGTGISFDFGSGAPQYFSNNMHPMIGASATISDASGQLLFYTNGYWVWNREHYIMPELTNGISGHTHPTAQTIGYPPLMPYSGGHAQQASTIAKVPRSQHLYYVFSLSKSGVLYYSMVDMSLNNGLGGIVNNKKGVYLYHGLTEKMSVVAGCDNIWLVTRALQSNAYHAFEIRDTGIVSTPVISTVGELPLPWYRTGSIRFSADGTRMAAACNIGLSQASGLELYDFDKVNGVVSNTQVLDSSTTERRYYGVCFSEDGSKLYASESSFFLQGTYGTFFPGKVRQFDLSLPGLPAVIASNTVLYTDPGQLPDLVGDLQRAVDGKIYFSSAYSNIPFHVISDPNQAGAAANVQAGQVTYPGGSPRQAMPNDVALAPVPDTAGRTIDTAACFVDPLILAADSGRHYLWSNGSTGRQLTVHQTGTYTVQFMNRYCELQRDTFKVRFYQLPVLSSNGHSCPGAGQGTAALFSSDSFNYAWYRGDELLQQHSTTNGSAMQALDTGEYQVRIGTPGGCDSIIEFRIDALPVPEARIDGDTLICAKTKAMFRYEGDAPLHEWSFSNGAIAATKEVNTIFYDTGYANVRLVVGNAEGCRDTMVMPIHVKGLDLQLQASEQLVGKGGTVRLQSRAPEQYEVLYWQPQELFGNNAAKWQQVSIDSSTTFYVTAVSADGCAATASVSVAVLSELQVPNAFTPNGDGRNDRFAPRFRGDVLIRKFEVYNRWGETVYSAWGAAAREGWDGTYKGRPCDMGTYFYYINVEIQQGKTLEQKGDVLLMR